MSTQRGIRNEIGLKGLGGVAPSRWRNRWSGGRAPSAGQFLRFFDKNDVVSGMFGLKFELQNIF